MPDVLVRTAESLTADLARRMLAARPGECVLCHTCRLVDDFGCNGTPRFSVGWLEQHRRSRPDVAGDQPGTADDGPVCDCSLLLTVWTLRDDLLVWSAELGALDWPATTPPCAGAAEGRACAVWVRQ
ncbi:hypothetical protein GCM10027446_09290 [Angustibacter peucedani]